MTKLDFINVFCLSSTLLITLIPVRILANNKPMVCFKTTTQYNACNNCQEVGSLATKLGIRIDLVRIFIILIIKSYSNTNKLFHNLNFYIPAGCEIDLEDESLQTITRKGRYPLIVNASGDIIYPVREKKLKFGNIVIHLFSSCR